MKLIRSFPFTSKRGKVIDIITVGEHQHCKRGEPHWKEYKANGHCKACLGSALLRVSVDGVVQDKEYTYKQISELQQDRNKTAIQ